MIKAGIIGATGYAGSELMRLLMNHPDVEIKTVTARSYVGKAYDEVYNSPIKTNDALRATEINIYEQSSRLYDSVNDKDLAITLANEIVKNTKERNAKLKAMR